MACWCVGVCGGARGAGLTKKLVPWPGGSTEKGGGAPGLLVLHVRHRWRWRRWEPARPKGHKPHGAPAGGWWGWATRVPSGTQKKKGHKCDVEGVAVPSHQKGQASGTAPRPPRPRRAPPADLGLGARVGGGVGKKERKVGTQAWLRARHFGCPRWVRALTTQPGAAPPPPNKWAAT